MTDACRNAEENDGKRRRIIATPQAMQDPKHICIQAGRGGDWMPAEELREASLAALVADEDVTLDLDHIGHLDASALQILLALDAEKKRQGRQIDFANVSPELRQWFEYAGMTDHFFPSGAERR